MDAHLTCIPAQVLPGTGYCVIRNLPIDVQLHIYAIIYMCTDDRYTMTTEEPHLRKNPASCRGTSESVIQGHLTGPGFERDVKWKFKPYPTIDWPRTLEQCTSNL